MDLPKEKYWARCRECGWQGPLRESFTEASQDCKDHRDETDHGVCEIKRKAELSNY
jgi:hypothetical protein